MGKKRKVREVAEDGRVGINNWLFRGLWVLRAVAAESGGTFTSASVRSPLVTAGVKTDSPRS